MPPLLKEVQLGFKSLYKGLKDNFIKNFIVAKWKKSWFLVVR